MAALIVFELQQVRGWCDLLLKKAKFLFLNRVDALNPAFMLGIKCRKQ
jgi:hypothetical protein